jgi:hypothetical protein
MKIASFPACQNPSITRYMGLVHVSTPPLEVARKIRREFPDGGLTRFLELDRTRRRFALACALNAHAENRQEYRLVMNRVDRPLEWRYEFDKTGTTPKTTVRIPS